MLGVGCLYYINILTIYENILKKVSNIECFLVIFRFSGLDAAAGPVQAPGSKKLHVLFIFQLDQAVTLHLFQKFVVASLGYVVPDQHIPDLFPLDYIVGFNYLASL